MSTTLAFKPILNRVTCGIYKFSLSLNQYEPYETVQGAFLRIKTLHDGSYIDIPDYEMNDFFNELKAYYRLCKEFLNESR